MERYSIEFLHDVCRCTKAAGYGDVVVECSRLKHEREIRHYDDYDITRTLCRYVCKYYTKKQRALVFESMAGVTRRYVLEFGKAVKRMNYGYKENPLLEQRINGVISEHVAGFTNGFDAVKTIVKLVEDSLSNGYVQSYNRIHPLRFNV